MGHNERWLKLGFCLLFCICLLFASCTRGGAVKASEFEVQTGEDGSAEIITGGDRISIGPKTTVTIREGQSRQPTPPRTSAAYASKGLKVLTGEAMQRLQSLEGSTLIMILGFFLGTVGVAYMITKRAGWGPLRLAPKGLGVAAVIGGAAMAVGPFMLEQYGWLLALAIFIGILAFIARWYFNIKKEPPAHKPEVL